MLGPPSSYIAEQKRKKKKRKKTKQKNPKTLPFMREGGPASQSIFPWEKSCRSSPRSSCLVQPTAVQTLRFQQNLPLCCCCWEGGRWDYKGCPWSTQDGLECQEYGLQWWTFRPPSCWSIRSLQHPKELPRPHLDGTRWSKVQVGFHPIRRRSWMATSPSLSSLSSAQYPSLYKPSQPFLPVLCTKPIQFKCKLKLRSHVVK